MNAKRLHIILGLVFALSTMLGATGSSYAAGNAPWCGRAGCGQCSVNTCGTCDVREVCKACETCDFRETCNARGACCSGPAVRGRGPGRGYGMGYGRNGACRQCYPARMDGPRRGAWAPNCYRGPRW